MTIIVIRRRADPVSTAVTWLNNSPGGDTRLFLKDGSSSWRSAGFNNLIKKRYQIQAETHNFFYNNSRSGITFMICLHLRLYGVLLVETETGFGVRGF